MRKSAIYQDILQEGREEGLQQGFTRGVEQVAANMLREGFEVEVVARLTGLQLAQIETLKEAIARQNEA